MSVKWARGSCLLTQLFPWKDYFTQTFCCHGKGTRTSGPGAQPCSGCCISSWDLSGWPQWPWLLQVTQSAKEDELGKGRCLCLSFPFLTLMCEKHFGTAYHPDLGIVDLWLCQNRTKREFPLCFSCFISHQKLPLFCLLCTEEILAVC